MSDAKPVVVVIDDDPGIRDALQGLLETIAVSVETFGSADAFLRSKQRDAANCIILDVRLPGPSGLDVQEELSQAKLFSPIVFITAHGDIPMTVRAMKAGALEFLTKPFRDQDLLDAVRQGINRDRARRAEERRVAMMQDRFATLTARERQIMQLLVDGRVNKQIAVDVDLSEVTVRVHRGQVVRKMGAKSLADLVRMADKLRASQALWEGF